MPKVETYGANKVSSGVVSGARASASDNGFGALGRGLAGFAQGLEIMQNKRDEAEAEEALVNFERDKNDVFFNPDSGYFNTQGRAAYDSASSTSESLDSLKEKYSSAFKSQKARELFDKAANAHITRARSDIDRHAAKGLDVWELSTIKAQAENSLENASLYYNDPEKMREFQIIGESQVNLAADREGISPEARAENLQTFRSAFTKNAVLGALNHSAAEAEKLVEKYSNQLEGPDKITLDAKIVAKKKQEKDTAVAATAVSVATSLVSTRGSRQEVIDEINTIKDPELQDKTMSEAMYRWSQKELAEKEQAEDNYNAADEFIRSGKGSVNEWVAANPIAWSTLTPTQRKNLAAGKNIETNWDRYNEIMSMSDAELLKVDMSKEASNFAPTERKALIALQRKTRDGGGSTTERQIGRTRAQQANQAVLQLMGRPKSKWKSDDLKRADALHALITSEANFREDQKGSTLTSKEFTDMLAELSRDVVIKRDYWFDDEMTVTDIPYSDAQALTEALHQRGIPVTAETLIRAYRQAKE